LEDGGSILSSPAMVSNPLSCLLTFKEQAKPEQMKLKIEKAPRLSAMTEGIEDEGLKTGR